MSQNDNNFKNKFKNKANEKPSLVLSADEYFIENLSEGFEKRKIKIIPEVVTYLSKLLNHYMIAENFFELEVNEQGQRHPRTLAELLLSSQFAEPTLKIELLKKLGDKSLYISGFFADSLNRSLVDLDYYKNMGASAYATLSSISKDTQSHHVYSIMASKFTQITDVLTLISQQSVSRSDQNILRFYESYLRTGSKLAEEQLSSLGVLTVSDKNSKKLSEH